MINFWVNVLPHAFCYLCALSNVTTYQKKKESNLNEQCFSVFLPHMLASLIADGSAGSVIIITIVCSLIMHRSAAAFHFCCSCIPTLWGWNRLSCFSSYYYFAHFYYWCCFLPPLFLLFFLLSYVFVFACVCCSFGVWVLYKLESGWQFCLFQFVCFINFKICNTFSII